ncbi:hypothetical protein ACFQO1_02800 [Jejudonia soesokkakensis]|uniref:T9SS type A sorting domain-containing protein n=1 Tax=Jejudonia soesokkakensis TaxID=1323432 RepID=A0ABW2MV04_9FLAO
MKKITQILIFCFSFLALYSYGQRGNTFTQIQNSNAYRSIVTDLDIQPEDQVIADDLIVDGSICAGFDCVDGENFGFDTFRIKENNLRIHFDDTSNSASFPNNDWRISINDTSNGGANYFAIDDATAGTNPFRIEASAPSNSLYVDDSGRVGFGTDAPVVEMHSRNGDSPTLRLDQDGSSGFTPQVWDVAGNETNFFVRDATNGSTLPFKIIPNSSENALVIRGDAIGIGGASNAVNANASIDLKSTAKGLLLNRMTTTDRTALANVEGMIVYDTDLNQLFSNDGTQWQSGGVDTDDQGVDVFQLNASNELELSLDNDGVATQTVDLSSFLDNTDDQGADVFQLNASNQLELSLEDDGVATQTVDLSSFLDNTDDQNISGSGLSGTTLTIGIEGGTSQTVDLSSLDDSGTDDQALSLSGNTLTLEDGGSVSLSSYLDNTDDQNISGSGLSGTTLTIGIEGGTSETVDLSSLVDSGTDDQALSLSGNTLTLEDGGSVNLSSYLDNTDDQNISGSGLSGTTLTIGIEGGASQTVDLSSLNNSGTDDQVLSLSGNTLTLEDGGTVDLSMYLDNTDNQMLANFILTGDILGITLQNGGTAQVDIGPLVDPLRDELETAQSQLAALSAQMNDVLARLEAIEDCACDGTLGVTDFNVQPDQPVLLQNIPNPFDNSTTIGYFIPFRYESANIIVSATSGRLLENYKIDRMGEGEIIVDKERMQAAVYFYTLYVDGKRIDTKRMVVE